MIIRVSKYNLECQAYPIALVLRNEDHLNTLIHLFDRLRVQGYKSYTLSPSKIGERQLYLLMSNRRYVGPRDKIYMTTLDECSDYLYHLYYRREKRKMSIW